MPGAAVVVTFDYTIVTADAVTGILTNIATATADSAPTDEKLTASDEAIVLAEDIPLSGVPALTLTKTVRNKTNAGMFGEVAGGLAGDVFEYRIIAMNNGSVALSNVMVRDDHAAIGSTVMVNGAAKTWAAGTDGKAVVNIGSLAIGAYATLTYVYTSTAVDEGKSLTNTVVADGTLIETLPNPVPTKIVSQPDTALLLVEEPIPEAGEHMDGKVLGGSAILAAGAAVLALALRRKKKEEEEPAE